MEKLLIVDDEEIELDGMAELIDWPSYGYELVGTAINGKRGLALIQEKQPDIVITDIKMPVMDGLAMIRVAQEQHVDTVFVVLSGYGDYEYTSQAMQLGIRHYILKPCDEAKILPVLEQARAELHERRSKAQKTTEMENTVRRMAPMAREKALRDLLRYGDHVVVEQKIKGREIQIAVLGDGYLPAVEIIPKGAYFDYESKYQAGGAVELCPAPITDAAWKQVGEMALKLHKGLGLSVYSRSDFILDENGQAWCLEINTLPGMTPTSLVPQEAAQVGLNYGELCEKIVELSLAARKAARA